MIIINKKSIENFVTKAAKILTDRKTMPVSIEANSKCISD